MDDTGTNTFPSCRAGDPVLLASWCSPTRVVHSSLPVAASSAYVPVRKSTKNAVCMPPGPSPITTAPRMAASAANVHWMQPVSRSSEYTSPYWLPTITRSPTTAGFERVCTPSGIPNAHLSVRFGTSSAVSPAWAAVRKPVASRSPPWPDQ